MSTEIINKKINRNVLLNPGPGTTSATVKSSLVVSDICPREKEFGDLLFDVRKKIVDVVNGGSNYEGILLGCSGTGAIEACISSCTDGKKGILIIENGAYGKRMQEICNAYGIQSTVLSFPWGSPIDLAKVDTHLLENASSYRVLAFIHHETTTGILNPLPELHQMAKKYKLASLVDAMSSYAGIPIDLQVTDVDYIVSSSNKCIHGMAGLGIVVAKREELETIASFKKKNFYLNLEQNFISQKKQGQFLFTPPVQILYALNQALDEFFSQGGGKARHGRYSTLYKILFSGMQAMGFKTVVEEKYHSGILTTFYAPASPQYSFEKMHNFLYQRGITIYPGKMYDENTFRISNLGELTEADMEMFLTCLRQYISSEGIIINEGHLRSTPAAAHYSSK